MASRCSASTIGDQEAEVMSLLNRLVVLLAATVPLGVGGVPGAVAMAKSPASAGLSEKAIGTFAERGVGRPTAVAVAGRYAYMTNACGVGCYGPLDVIDVSV